MNNNPSRASAFMFANESLPEEKAIEMWLLQKTAIEHVQQGKANQLRFEELYRNSYNLVLHKYGELLYRGVRQCVKDRLAVICKEVSQAIDSRLLEVLVHQWEEHKLVMGMIRDILLYMDNQYCPQVNKTPTYEMGLILFRHHIVRNPEINTRMRRMLLHSFEAERNGEQANRSVARNCLSMLVEVCLGNTADVYIQDFEVDFLEATKQFYLNESRAFIADNTIPEYLRKVQNRLQVLTFMSGLIVTCFFPTPGGGSNRSVFTPDLTSKAQIRT
jgi:cullin 3